MSYHEDELLTEEKSFRLDDEDEEFGEDFDPIGEDLDEEFEDDDPDSSFN